MKLPFLKNKTTPRVAPAPDEKVINASLEEKLENHLIGELMAAAAEKNAQRFREAIEALILNCFEEETDPETA